MCLTLSKNLNQLLKRLKICFVKDFRVIKPLKPNLYLSVNSLMDMFVYSTQQYCTLLEKIASSVNLL